MAAPGQPHQRAILGGMRHTIYTVKVTATGFCRACRGERRIYHRRPDHAFQLLVTLVTAGLWAVPWLAMWIVSLRRPWRCQICRRPVEKDDAPAGVGDSPVINAAPWTSSSRR